MKEKLRLPIIIVAILFLVGGGIAWKKADNEKKKPAGPEGTNIQYTLAFDNILSTAKIKWVSDGVQSDSLLVHGANRWVRKIAPISSWLSNYAKIDGTTNVSVFANNANYVNLSGARSGLNLTTTGTGAATYNSTTGTFNIPTPTIPAQVNITGGNRISVTGTYPNLTISYIEPTINQVTRNVNTNYTIGARQATVFYAVPVTATNPLLLGTSVGTAFLEYSTNAGTNWTTALPTSTQSSVGLSVTIQLTTGGSNVLSGVVPANALVRIRTTVSGTATVGNATGQEVY